MYKYWTFIRFYIDVSDNICIIQQYQNGHKALYSKYLNEAAVMCAFFRAVYGYGTYFDILSWKIYFFNTQRRDWK